MLYKETLEWSRGKNSGPGNIENKEENNFSGGSNAIYFFVVILFIFALAYFFYTQPKRESIIENMNRDGNAIEAV